MENLTAAFDTTITKEEAQEFDESRLIPAGTYHGLLQPVSPEDVVTGAEGGPMEGRPIYRCRAHLLMEDGTERVLFWDATPAVVKATSSRGGSYVRPESEAAIRMYQATGLFGQPFSRVLEAMTTKPYAYKVGIRKASADGKYPAKNSLRGIAPIEGA